MKIPGAVLNLIEAFERLPGIGPKTAARLTYYLLQAPMQVADSFSESLARLKRDTRICSVCKNIAETDPCGICSDSSRERTIVCLVEKPLDVLSIEKSGKFHGLYHILGGLISPLNNIGPDELYIKELIKRLEIGESREVGEVILATNAGLEGEATAMYLSKIIKKSYPGIRVTRIGRGLPVGSDIEYADEVTLSRAMEGRSEY